MSQGMLYELEMEEASAPELDAEVQTPLEAALGTALRVLGTDDYLALRNKPSIEGVTLEGDRSFRALGLDAITEADIDEIMFGEG